MSRPIYLRDARGTEYKATVPGLPIFYLDTTDPVEPLAMTFEGEHDHWLTYEQAQLIYTTLGEILARIEKEKTP